MRYCAVAAATPDDTTALPAQRWWRGQDPDPELVRRMFLDEGRTEVEIAAAMKISRARLAAVLTELGVDRGGRVRRVCPVGDADLRVLLEQGATVASLARRFSVAKVNVQRWLAGAGLLLPDPAVDVEELSRLPIAGGLVIPGDHRLARVVVVVRRRHLSHHHIRSRHQPADPADRRDQLRDRVLRRDRVIQHR